MSANNFEKDISQTGDFFKYLHSSMKSSMPFWDDFLQKGQRFQRSLEQSLVAFNSFLDGFAKLAELATNSKGATHEMGLSLTNMIRWQKALELKIRELNFSLSTKLLTPVTHRIDEWKKQLSNLEKDHDKELNKPLKEAKESVKNAIKAHKSIESKKRKDKQVGVLQAQFEQLQMEMNHKIADVEQKEKVHMSRIMAEERVWYSTLINTFLTVLDQLVIIGADFNRLPTLMTDLKEQSMSPSILPEAKRDFIEEWQIPSIHTPRLRGTSVSVTGTGNITKADSVLSYENLATNDNSNTLQISSPVMAPTPPPQDIPVLSSYVQNPPTVLDTPTPPTQNLPEDYYDVPVAPPQVSVSPSQVSLVSNGSHYSSESNSSSVRSASPHLVRNTVPQQTLPTMSYQIPSTVSSSYQTPPTNNSHYQQPNPFSNDLPFVNRSDMTSSTMKYIPATLPRPPRKDHNQQLTAPKTSANRNIATPTISQLQRQNTDITTSHYQRPVGVVRQSSLPEQNEGGSDEEENLSAFALALKQKKLRRTVHMNDRSGPKK